MTISMQKVVPALGLSRSLNIWCMPKGTNPFISFGVFSVFIFSFLGVEEHFLYGVKAFLWFSEPAFLYIWTILRTWRTFLFWVNQFSTDNLAKEWQWLIHLQVVTFKISRYKYPSRMQPHTDWASQGPHQFGWTESSEGNIQNTRKGMPQKLIKVNKPESPEHK